MEGRRARKGKIGLETHFPTTEEAQPHLLGGHSDPSLPSGWEKKMSLLLPVYHQFYFLFEI